MELDSIEYLNERSLEQLRELEESELGSEYRKALAYKRFWRNRRVPKGHLDRSMAGEYYIRQIERVMMERNGFIERSN